MVLENPPLMITFGIELDIRSISSHGSRPVLDPSDAFLCFSKLSSCVMLSPSNCPILAVCGVMSRPHRLKWVVAPLYCLCQSLSHDLTFKVEFSSSAISSHIEFFTPVVGVLGSLYGLGLTSPHELVLGIELGLAKVHSYQKYFKSCFILPTIFVNLARKPTIFL